MESPTWRRQLAGRLLGHWRLKAVGIPAFIGVFFVGYFLILKFPAFPVTRVPYLPIDRMVGFHPGSIALYLSLWLYVTFAPALLGERSELRLLGATATALAVVGFAIFFFWPTAVPNPDIDWSAHPSFMWLKTIDASGNACPSLHAAYALFAAVWIQRSLRRIGAPALLMLLNLSWCGGILYSTLATKQHVMVDLAAGAALGWVAALPRGRRPA
jgi:hypothetical protein